MAVLSKVLFAALLAWSLAGCRISVDYGDKTFACSDGECPSGFTCQAEICVLDEAVGDPADAAVEIDATIADAATPDALALATCDDLFADAPGYQLCSEDDVSCSFNVNTAGGTCADACAALNTECLGAFDNNADLCLPVEATGDTCDTPRNSEICVCARPDAPPAP